MNVTAFKRRKEFGKTLASDIAHRMRNEIVTCRLKPGEVLKFDTLRLAYGASFTTLREALTCLAASGPPSSRLGAASLRIQGLRGRYT